MFAIFQDRDAVDEYVPHPDRILMRFLEGCAIANGGGIEDDDIRMIAGLQRPPVFDAEVGGGQGGEPMDGLIERNQLLVANISAKQTREIARRAAGRLLLLLS